MEVGVKESSKNKLERSTWAGHVEKWEINNWQIGQVPRKCRGNRSEKDRNCDGGGRGGGGGPGGGLRYK